MPPKQELGDDGVLEEVSKRLRKRIENDPLLFPFFKGVDMDVLSRKHNLFFTMLFLGNTEIVADKLYTTHHKFRKDGGIKEQHFNAFAAHIEAACVELNISSENLVRVRKALQAVKPAIVS